MRFRRHFCQLQVLLLSAGFVCANPPAVADVPQKNVAPNVAVMRDVGPIDEQVEFKVLVKLKMNRQDEFDQKVAAVTDPGSPTYHQWLSPADMDAYAPPPGNVAAVRAEFQRDGLSVEASGACCLLLTGTGKVMAQAFGTQFRMLDRNGKAVRYHVTDARVPSSISAMVHSVSGLDEHHARPQIKLLSLNAGASGSIGTSGDGFGSIITSTCLAHALTPQKTYEENYLRTALDAKGNLIYTGATIDAKESVDWIYLPGSSLLPNLNCGYSAKEIRDHYGLEEAGLTGFRGQGEHIVLLEAYDFDYATVLADANEFSRRMGIAGLDGAHLVAHYPHGKPYAYCNPTYDLGPVCDWHHEIALDVQWAHAMAPDAIIDVVYSYSDGSVDQLATLNWLSTHQLGYVVSGSWDIGLEENISPPELDLFEASLKALSAMNVSLQFGSGDLGVNSYYGQYPITAYGSVVFPSSSPHVTSVGGTSLLNHPGTGHHFEIGWGTFGFNVNETPDQYRFLGMNYGTPTFFQYQKFGGSGGGESSYFTKPSWQKGLPGTGRQTPDISALADLHTGVPVVVNGQINMTGGTSLATPMISAMIAVANQKAGVPLGLAAPLIAASSSSGSVRDTHRVPSTASGGNVAIRFTDSTGRPTWSLENLLTANFYAAMPLNAHLPAPTSPYLTAFVPASGASIQGDGSNWVFVFGFDAPLVVDIGWDNVTGYGVPNGTLFVDGLIQAARQ